MSGKPALGAWAAEGVAAKWTKTEDRWVALTSPGWAPGRGRRCSARPVSRPLQPALFLPPRLLDISEAQWRIVRDILQRIVPARQVWAFGSRARHKAKPFSDLDLVIMGEQPLPIEESAALADEFSQSDLPWKVDVVDWATTSAPFRRVIEQDKVVVQDGPDGAQASLVAPFTPAPEPSGAAPGGRGRRPGRSG